VAVSGTAVPSVTLISSFSGQKGPLAGSLFCSDDAPRRVFSVDT